MHPNPFLGVLLHWLGGLASGSFYVPFRGVKRWSWETFWLVGGVFSWIIAPWFFALLNTNDLLAVLSETPGRTHSIATSSDSSGDLAASPSASPCVISACRWAWLSRWATARRSGR